MTDTTLQPSDSNPIYADIRRILDDACQQSRKAVNFAMLQAYWLIVQRIVQEEQHGEVRAEYGKGLMHNLSQQLTADFGRGFSEASLWNFRQFYLSYPDAQKLATLCRELSWSHYHLLMRVENPNAREYYQTEAAAQNWSVRTLERYINTLTYERLLTASDKNQALQALQNKQPQSAQDFIKDPYVLEFLQFPAPPHFSEHQLESAIIGNLQQFLMELGKGFCFYARQYRISTETKHFFIDLVFYNHLLKCFVLIDLKAGELTHQDVGQMDMYVRMFEDLMRGEDDNPSIGLLLCTEKDQTIVRYSVLNESQQLFAAKYRTVLPSEDELRAEIERERAKLLSEEAGDAAV